MTLILILAGIIQTFAISLGVGSSTLAIVNFFVAIADGVIDATERRMMGVVYIILRVAMVAILLTTTLLLASEYLANGLVRFGGIEYAEILVLLVLYTNAVLMTKHLMPSTFGPALQAGNWYTLGTLAALQIIALDSFTFTHFLMAYVAWLALAVAIVNTVMAVLESKRKADSALGS